MTCSICSIHMFIFEAFKTKQFIVNELLTNGSLRLLCIVLRKISHFKFNGAQHFTKFKKFFIQSLRASNKNVYEPPRVIAIYNLRVGKF